MYLEWNYISFTHTNVLFWTDFSFEQNQKNFPCAFISMKLFALTS